jgi:hypothetical protein
MQNRNGKNFIKIISNGFIALTVIYSAGALKELPLGIVAFAD